MKNKYEIIQNTARTDVKKALSAGDRETLKEIYLAAVVQPGKSLNRQHGGQGQREQEPGRIAFSQK